MMTKLAAWICALACTATWCGAAQLPEELAVIESLSADETAMVEAAHRFYTQSKKLLEWDQALLADHRTAGQQELAKSKQAEIERRIELMETAWTHVLSVYKNNATANNYYGEFLYDYRKEERKGFQHWMIAVKIDDGLHRAHNNLGIHYFHSGDVPKGLSHLTKTLKLDPKNPDYLFNAAQMYLNFFPQLEKALGLTKPRLYKKAMTFSRDAARYGEGDYTLYKDYAVNFWAGENLGVKVNWVDAAKAWQEARKYAPSQSETFHTLINEGRAWLKAERWDNALNPLTAASRIRPNGPAISTLMKRAKAGAAASKK